MECNILPCLPRASPTPQVEKGQLVTTGNAEIDQALYHDIETIEHMEPNKHS